MSDVLIHPSVRETLRRWSVGWCISARPRAVAPFVKAGYISCLSGDALDFRTRRKAKERLYRITRKGLQVAYPDGHWVRRYACVVCGKVTAGRLPGNYPGIWFPRKHGGCSGYSKEARAVRVLVRY